MILQKLNDSLTTPIPFFDKNINRKQVYHSVLQIIIINIISVLLIGVILYFFTHQLLWLSLTFVMVMAHLPAFVFLKYEHVNLALITVPIAVFVTLTTTIMLRPDLLNVLVSFLGINIISIGILVGSRAAFVMTGFSIVVYATVLLLTTHSVLSPTAETPKVIQIILSISALVGFSLIGYFSIRTIRTIYRQIRESNIELEKTKQDLEQYAAELLAANQALETNKATKQAIIDSIPDMMAIIDKSGVYHEYKAPSYFRHEDPPESVIGRKINDLLTHQLAQERWQHIQHVLATGERIEYEENQPVRGNPHIFSTRIMAIDDDKALVLMRDITEAKQQEAANLAAQKRESVGLLAGGVAHDFNNLLTGMLAQTSLALRKLPPDHGAVKNIRKANIAAERAADLTRQLLAYTGQGSFKIEIISLNDIIRENAALIRATLPPQVSLELDLNSDLPLIEADPSQIQQIIMNLIINAMEAMQETTGCIYVQTFVKQPHEIQKAMYSLHNFQPETEHYVCLQVQDEGSGIPKKILTKIFDPFFSTKSGGRGLGLSATLGIIRRYHGGIQIENRSKQGSCFTVFLPAQTVTAVYPTPTITADTPTHNLQTLQLLHSYVLIIDDETSVRETIQDVLQQVNVKTLSADNGVDGVQLFKNHQGEIALVILDMKMPGQSGMETFVQLREINSIIPIMVASGYTEEEVTRQFAYKVSHYLQKPFNTEALITAVQHALV